MMLQRIHIHEKIGILPLPHFSKIESKNSIIGGTLMRKFFVLLFTTILLVGCGDTLDDIKNAASGINSRANEAATAISIDVHSIRATEVQYNNLAFTINDVFKNILRDVQWYYEEIEQSQLLKISGTWQNKNLFANQNFTDEQKKQLLENGDVEVVLTIDNGELQEQQTTITMQLGSELLVEESGQAALQHFYDLYIATQ